jgi:ABC-type cobalamin/Fe3+-siderophores transport system ATPase subunit
LKFFNKVIQKMPFNLSFASPNPAFQNFIVESGSLTFLLGANGTGKSSLMFRFASQNGANVRKISAHRQTWMNSDALDMTPQSKIQTEIHINNEDKQNTARYRDQFAAQRASMTVYELIDAQNMRFQKIGEAVDSGKMDEAAQASKETEAPISIINELLGQSNIPITISVEKNQKIVASKNGSPPFSAAQLSDGERNALLVAGAVLTAPANSLLLIDEPERHLHRSIISPLLRLLFGCRSDCAFVVSTHDHDLPLDNASSQTVLVRSCDYNGPNPTSWEADLLSNELNIDDILRRDLLGARRQILFVEGTEESIDKPLYSIIFPMVSIVPKGSCREVEQSVVGLNAGQELHWLRAFGIADSDALDDERVASMKDNGVFAVPYYSVEAIYFHPRVIEFISQRRAAALGGHAHEMVSNAIQAGIQAVRSDAERLCRKAAKKAVRKAIMEQIPNDDDILNGAAIEIEIDAPTTLEERVAAVEQAANDNDWEAMLAICPIRECSAQKNITDSLGFKSIEDYRKAVRHLLSNDKEALQFVRNLFLTLYVQIAD